MLNLHNQIKLGSKSLVDLSNLFELTNTQIIPIVFDKFQTFVLISLPNSFQNK